MSFDPLLVALGIAALATPTTAVVFAPNADRAGVNIQPGFLPITNPQDGDIVVDAVDGTLKWFHGGSFHSAGGAPAGTDTQIQFNAAGAFGASSGLLWDDTYKYLNVTGTNSEAGASIFVDSMLIALAASPYDYYSAAVTQTVDFHEAQSGCSYAPITANATVSITNGADGGLIDSLNGVGVDLALGHQLGVGESVELGSSYGTHIHAVYSSDGAGSLVLGQLGGLYVDCFFTATAGGMAVESYTGLHFNSLSVASGVTITDFYGLYLGSASGAGTITNRYGIYQADTLSTNYFAGDVSIGVAPLSGCPLYIGGAGSYGALFTNTIYESTALTGLSLTQVLDPNGVAYLATGLNVQPETNSVGSTYWTGCTFIGGKFEPQFQAETTTNYTGASIIGVDAHPRFITTTDGCTLGYVYGVRVRGGANNGGFTGTVTILNSYGVYIDTFSDGGMATITNRYGVYQEDTTARNYFGGSVEVSAAQAFYYGAPDTDGSWRSIRSGNDLLHQRRESAVWVTKQTIPA